jgi:hypothetical protein
MIVAVNDNDGIELYDITGVFLNVTTTEQKNIEFMSAGNRGDDPIVATYAEGVVYIHRIESKRINATRENDTVVEVQQAPNRVQSRMSIYTTVESTFVLVEPIESITDFEYSTIKGSKYVIFSDSRG